MRDFAVFTGYLGNGVMSGTDPGNVFIKGGAGRSGGASACLV